MGGYFEHFIFSSKILPGGFNAQLKMTFNFSRLHFRSYSNLKLYPMKRFPINIIYVLPPWRLLNCHQE